MANALDTVANYVTQARVLLQDTAGPDFRYGDLDFVEALNFGLMRARQLRADFFIATDGVIPYFVENDDTMVPFPIFYRHALLNFIVGQVQARDAEDTTDARATMFQNSFVTQLTMGSGVDIGGGE